MALDLESFSYCTRSALKYNRLILKMRKLLKQTRDEWYVINWKKRRKKRRERVGDEKAKQMGRILSKY
jgi:hypothetical protein